MKMYLICDNDETRIGMRLSGIDGVMVHTREELKNHIKLIKTDKEIGVVLITEKTAEKFPDLVQELKLTRSLPLVVEVPDRHGTTRKADSISSYVREAVGGGI